MMIACFISCTKTNPNQDNNNSGNNGGGNSGITITSISPANPYPDDTITIMGTGFNSDKLKDSVEFGVVSTTSAFKPWHDGLESEWANKTIVLETTSTKLVIKAKNPYQLDYDAFFKLASSPADSSPPSIAGVRGLTGLALLSFLLLLLSGAFAQVIQLKSKMF